MPRSETSKMIMFYVYVLESLKNGNLYTGYTKDLKKRLEEHNRGLNLSTKPYMPWKVIYYEACLNEKDAKRREGYLKKTQGAKNAQAKIKRIFL